MINWFNMPEEGLSNGGQFEIKELTATENKVYQKDGEVYSKVTVNVEGGGGSSDFSTAEVTISTAGVQAFGYIPIVYISGDTMHAKADEIGPFVLSQSYNAILYKGECRVTIYGDNSNINVSVTGNAEVDGEADMWDVYITGDCTITVTEAS